MIYPLRIPGFRTLFPAYPELPEHKDTLYEAI